MMRRTARSEFRRVMSRARTCARLAGSDTIEAEHLLLALAGEGSTVAYAVLSHSGLDQHRIADALAVEQAESLAAVGITALPPPPPVFVTDVNQLGESAKLAIVRGATAGKLRKERPIRAAHLLIGLLSADVGRVPRALAVAGIDRQLLLAETQTALDSFLGRTG
ncbi:MAG: beta-lactamase [Frankiales bacterium]|nr:beta-lactamase [Frankiales bacterium]